MAMLIYRFHKLIQSKLLWGTFLVIVVFSFVIWGTQMPKRAADADEAASPGKLHGKNVPREVFRKAYFDTYLSVIMSMGRQISITKEMDVQLRKAAWQRIAALEQAAALGFSTSDDEIAASIQRHPAFSQQGRFNKPAYKNFVGNFLAQMGMSERGFEEYMREEVTLQKARAIVEKAVLIAPSEIKRTFSSLSDNFKIQYAALKPELVEKSVQVTREDERALFDKDPSAFKIPEKVKIKYVYFPATNFQSQVSLDAEQLQTYYDENITDFPLETPAPATNEAPAAPAAPAAEPPKAEAPAPATNAPAPAAGSTTTAAGDDAGATGSVATAQASDSGPTGTTFTILPETNAAKAAPDTTFVPPLLADPNAAPEPQKPLYKPFEEVKGQIETLLTKKAEMELAKSHALEFVVTLSPDRDGNAPTFEDAAKGTNLTVLTAGPFSRFETVPGIDASSDFNASAFNLTMAPDSYFSDPIEGMDGVYVVALTEKIPERIPTFDEVADKVMPVAKKQAVAEALTKKAGEIRDAAIKAVAEGKSFAETLSSFGVEAKTTGEFTANTLPTEDQYGKLLMRGVMARNEGEVTDLLPLEDEILLAYVAQRTPGDPTTYESLKQNIVSTLRRQYGRILFDSWQEQLLADAKLEEKAVPSAEEPAEGGAEEGEPSQEDKPAAGDKPANEGAQPAPSAAPAP
jgi:hypothetical protein